MSNISAVKKKEKKSEAQNGESEMNVTDLMNLLDQNRKARSTGNRFDMQDYAGEVTATGETVMADDKTKKTRTKKQSEKMEEPKPVETNVTPLKNIKQDNSPQIKDMEGESLTGVNENVVLGSDGYTNKKITARIVVSNTTEVSEPVTPIPSDNFPEEDVAQKEEASEDSDFIKAEFVRKKLDSEQLPTEEAEDDKSESEKIDDRLMEENKVSVWPVLGAVIIVAFTLYYFMTKEPAQVVAKKPVAVTVQGGVQNKPQEPVAQPVTSQKPRVAVIPVQNEPEPVAIPQAPAEANSNTAPKHPMIVVTPENNNQSISTPDDQEKLLNILGGGN